MAPWLPGPDWFSFLVGIPQGIILRPPFLFLFYTFSQMILSTCALQLPFKCWWRVYSTSNIYSPLSDILIDCFAYLTLGSELNMPQTEFSIFLQTCSLQLYPHHQSLYKLYSFPGQKLKSYLWFYSFSHPPNPTHLEVLLSRSSKHILDGPLYITSTLATFVQTSITIFPLLKWCHNTMNPLCCPLNFFLCNQNIPFPKVQFFHFMLLKILHWLLTSHYAWGKTKILHMASKRLPDLTLSCVFNYCSYSSLCFNNTGLPGP